MFSQEEAIAEVKKVHPDFNLTKDNISHRAFSYIISYDLEDKRYLFKVSKRACKILNEKVAINEEKAREIARSKVDQEPYMVQKKGNNWNFYYSNGLRLIIDEVNGNVVSKEIVSFDQVEIMAKKRLVKDTGESQFQVVDKKFKDGKWFLNLVSDRWEAGVEIDESGKIKQKLKMKKEFCLEQARKILEKYKISAAMQKSAELSGNGWLFNFLCSVGDLTIKVSPEEKKFVRKRLTPEGIKHFIDMEFGGEIVEVKDKQTFWEISLKREGKIFYLDMNKQDGDILRVKTKQFLFWKDVDVDQLRKTID